MIDAAIKYNLVPGHKTIIDIGTDSTKILEVNYASKEINVEEAHFIKSGYDKEKGFTEIARKIGDTLDRKMSKDIIVILPSSLTESKIIPVKNKSDKESKKILYKQRRNFGKSNPLTHEVRSTLLGTREEQGDTVSYYLITSITKGAICELYEAFDLYKIEITRIVGVQFGQVCLSLLFSEDYDNINRILVDFGNTESRIMVFADRVAVYSRTIPIGFQSYVKKLFDADNTAGKKEILSALINIGDTDVDEETAKDKLFNIGKSFYYESISEVNKQFFKEFERILDMCSNSEIEVSKVYFSGYVLNGFLTSFMNNTELECELIRFDNDEFKAGDGVVIDIQAEEPLNSRFSNAVGMTICPLI